MTGIFPCGQQMVKYGYKETAECTLCKNVYEESGSSWNRELPKETIGHIQSVGCSGQKEVVITAHNTCIRELLQEVDGHGKTDRHMKLLMIETESNRFRVPFLPLFGSLFYQLRESLLESDVWHYSKLGIIDVYH